jgi:hypothetical protein
MDQRFFHKKVVPVFAIACSHVSMKLSIVFSSYASFVFGGVQAGCVYL